MTTQNRLRFMVAMDDVIILKKEFSENPSLEAKDELISAEKYLDALHEEMQSEDDNETLLREMECD